MSVHGISWNTGSRISAEEGELKKALWSKAKNLVRYPNGPGEPQKVLRRGRNMSRFVFRKEHSPTDAWWGKC